MVKYMYVLVSRIASQAEVVLNSKRKLVREECIRAISLGVAINMSDHLSHASLIAGHFLFVCYSVEQTKQVPETSSTCP